MKHVSEISMQQAVSAARPAPEPLQIDEGSARVVNALFRELKAIFPAWRHAWSTHSEESAARLSWVKAFSAAGLRNLDQIRYGVEQCRASGRPFMPSVGEFIAWCRPTPEQLGCPSGRAAYLQACQLAHPSADRSSAHPAVWHAAQEVGLYVLASLPESKSWPAFERAYSLTLGMIERGEQLREIPKALPASVSAPANPDRVRSALEEMRKKLKGVA